MMNKPEVQVIDDDAAVRSALSFLLSTADIPSRTHESATEFMKAASDLPPGCIITDVRMPGMDGLELVSKLKAKGVPHPVIVITGHGDIALAVEAMKSGARDFLEKPFDAEVMLRAVQSALDAEGQASQAEADRRRYREVLQALSPREQDVLQRVVAGKANKVIACELDISPRTVEVHRANMMMKSGAGSLSELVRMALLAGV